MDRQKEKRKVERPTKIEVSARLATAEDLVKFSAALGRDELPEDARERISYQQYAYVIKGGEKQLLLTISEEIATTVMNDGSAQKKGATTALYTKALEIMQNIVDADGTPREYGLETINNSMREWARADGRRIFKWSTEEDDGDEGGLERSIFRATIKPTEKE